MISARRIARSFFLRGRSPRCSTPRGEIAQATGLPAGIAVVRTGTAGAVGWRREAGSGGGRHPGTSGVILAHTDSHVVEPAMRIA
jgi:xylulokinase